MTKKKKGTRRKTGGHWAVQRSLWLPELVDKELSHRAVEEECSKSWLVVSALCDYLDIDEEEISEARGYKISKNKDRSGSGEGEGEGEGLVDAYCPICGQFIATMTKENYNNIDGKGMLDSLCKNDDCGKEE